jgi:integrase
MRPAEMLGLRRRDVYPNDGFLMVTGNLVQAPGKAPAIEATKTKHSRRRIDLRGVAVAALRERRKRCFSEGGGELVFTAAGNQPIHDDNLRHRWWKPLLVKAAEIAEKAAREAGDSAYRFPTALRLYDLRHTANALNALAGVPLQVARERMGHASMKLTAGTYGHLYPSMQRDAADRIEGLSSQKSRGKVSTALVYPLVYGDDANSKKAM